MPIDKDQFRLDFPCIVKSARSTLYLKHPPSASTSQALFGLIHNRRHTKVKRVSTPVVCSDAHLFAKAQVVDSIKAKIRITLGKPQRDGRFDWPVEELLNTVEACKRGADVPALMGYGFKKSRLGIIEEFFIITRLLDQHIDGLQWLERNPDEVDTLIKKSFAALGALHERRITHMDLWAANLMLDEQSSQPAKAIDLENCFHTPPQYPSETLGFQFGFLYHREIYRFITEARYDELAAKAIEAYKHLDPEKFKTFYQAGKHEKIGRKERRRIFLEGVLDLS
ncbi:lipopolysaccharide kinase InaA family protein [Pseudomonas sp. GM78]|uniref:lipopolysaccharide kinase InaA family protein n=1 Tax=Pseudomonas sp. GM78 TaxID=1144337 RepID=UPI000519C83B|nr:lipopolysaccharide kinase InaA family protein [Pseudomonas sp. GM78]